MQSKIHDQWDWMDADFLVECLLAHLAAFKWQPITAENLPKTGDEVGHYWELGKMWILREYETGEKIGKDTHFRPINPPIEATPEGETK